MFKTWWDTNRKKSEGWTAPEMREGREVWNAAIEAALDVISGSESAGCYNAVERLQDDCICEKRRVSDT
jgi:hypothetical protein